MAAMQREWARRKRDELRAMLGGKCAKCGTRGSIKNGLEFDCKEPRGDRHHRIEWSSRMSFYKREHEQGNLQLLCKRCHGFKSNGEVIRRRVAV